MSLDDTIQRVQEAGWQSVANLPDAESTTASDLAGWAAVARAATPLLQDAGHDQVTTALTETARSIPARPAAQADPTPHLAELAAAIEDLTTQVNAQPERREDAATAVAVTLQAAAMVEAEHTRDAPNPQVRQVGQQLAKVAVAARSAHSDRRARAISPGPRPEAATASPTARREQARTPQSRDDSPRITPDATRSQGPSLT